MDIMKVTVRWSKKSAVHFCGPTQEQEAWREELKEAKGWKEIGDCISGLSLSQPVNFDIDSQAGCKWLDVLWEPGYSESAVEAYCRTHEKQTHTDIKFRVFVGAHFQDQHL